MLPLKQVQSVTGYIRGGVTALGMKKDYPVFADETIELWDTVCVSAGQRGLQIVIAPADYLRATAATVARDFTRKAMIEGCRDGKENPRPQSQALSGGGLLPRSHSSRATPPGSSSRILPISSAGICRYSRNC